MFGSPEMMIASFAIQQVGAQRARSARNAQAAAQAAQYEQNAKFEQLRALQEHNARVDAFSAYEGTANAVRGFNNRSTNDRSLKARVKAGKDKNTDDLNRGRVQTLFTQGRQRFAAADTMSAAATANQTSMFNSAASALDVMYKYNQVT